MAPCEDVYDDPDGRFLPTPFAGWPPPGLPDSRPLVERPDPPYWLYLPPPPPAPGSPRDRGLVVGPAPSGTLVQCFVAGERLLPGDAVSLGLDGDLYLVRDGAVPFAVVGAPCSEGNVVGFATLVLEPGTWSNRVPAPPLTLGTLRAAVAEIEPAGRVRAAPVFPIESWNDGVTAELIALARDGDEALFREIAGCVMPVADVTACWAGARARLGFPT